MELVFLKVPRIDLTKVTGLVLVEEGPVVVHVIDVSAVAGVLLVLLDAAMPGAHVILCPSLPHSLETNFRATFSISNDVRVRQFLTISLCTLIIILVSCCLFISYHIVCFAGID